MLQILEALPSTEHAAEAVIVYDIATVVNAAFQQKIEPTQAGRIPKRISNKLRPQLKGQPRLAYDGSDGYTDMILDLLNHMHILQVSKPPFNDIKPCVEPGPQLAVWSHLDLAGQIRLLLREWAENKQIIDVVGTDFDPWNSQHYSMDVRKGRQTLLKHLKTCEVNKWYKVEALVEELWEKDPGAMANSPSKVTKGKDAHQRWMKSEAQVFIGMLDSTLRDMGLVALGYDVAPTEENYRNPDTFMLTDLATVVFANEEPKKTKDEQAADQRCLIVQPNFELLLLHPDLSILYKLLPFIQVNQIGVASRMTLTKASLLRGLTGGENLEGIIQTLERYSQKELPQNVVYSLRDWARQYKEVRISQVLLLEISNEEMMSQLCASPKLQEMGIHQLTPFILAVNGDSDLQELRKIIEKEGIVPHLVGNFSNRANGRSNGRSY